MSIGRYSYRLLPLAVRGRSTSAVLQRGYCSAISPRAPALPVLGHHHQQLHLELHQQDLKRRLHLTAFKNADALSQVGSLTLHWTQYYLKYLKQAEQEELVPEQLYSRVVIKVCPAHYLVEPLNNGCAICLTFQVKGADFRVLDSYCRYVITAAKALGINIGKK